MSLLELMPCIFSRGMSLPACQGMVGLFVRSGGFYRRFWVGWDENVVSLVCHWSQA